jgi:competence CoiA-like predicted nuclease
MIFALKAKKRVRANPILKEVFCPYCGGEVIAKCGKIKIWHFAHKQDWACDDWKGKESDWHLEWKSNFDGPFQEVIVKKENKRHTADIKTSNMVVEFQNSSISSEDISKREEFYGEMIWVMNGDTLCKNMELTPKGEIVTFRWKWPHKSWKGNTKTIYIDMGYRDLKHILLCVGKIYWDNKNGKVRGWGKIITKEKLLGRINDGYCGH